MTLTFNSYSKQDDVSIMER